ncbi:MAG: tRNA pseudouridine(38-40) synthase TruA [Eubacteriales bacterium]|nr:tRNA pseudouridine(38-40) synthase TruA [Eubacteriales bacterium]
MKRYRLRVAYDGSNYHGWQEQNNGITIEQVLNETLSKVLKEEITVIGASRTDAGVHAYGNVAVFDSETRIPAEKICYAVNPFLPADIRIMKSEEVEDDFHPRFVDSRKTYEYHIHNSRIPFPTNRLYSHQVIVPLDVEAMQEAGKYMVGTHDFKCFCAAKAQVKTTVRTVNDVRVRKNGDEIIVEVQGEGFLYNMVRIITGTLIKVGLHAYPPEHVKEIIASKDRAQAGETVPAKGLFLQQIEYL